MKKNQRQRVKRKPLLIDRVLASKPDPDWVGRQYDVIRSRLRDAKVFKLDNQAAIYAAQMIKAHPEAIVRDHDFAIPPFPQTYVEFPYQGFFAALGGRNREGIPPDADVGYFIDGPRAYVMAWADFEWDGGRQGEAAILPVRYKLNEPFTMQQELAAAEQLECSRIQFDALYWGTTYDDLKSREDRRLLRQHHSFELWYGDIERWQNYMKQQFIITCAGDLRNILAMTLFLNRTAEYQYKEEIPPAPGFVHAKPRTLLRHSVVTLKLDPKPLLHKVYDTSKRVLGTIWHREHDVRAHFCHDKIARQHGHRLRMGDVPQTHEPEWTEIHVNCWKCKRCGGLRWHKETHKRGTKNSGRVRTSYKVKK